MDFLYVYTCVLLGLGTLFGLITLAVHWLQKIQAPVEGFVLRQLRCREIIRRRGPWGPLNVGQLLWMLLLSACAIVGNVVGLSSGQSVGSRAGQQAVLFIVPLFASAHFGWVADLLGTFIRRVRFLHAAIGAVAFAEALLHTALTARRSNLGSRSGFWGCVGGVAMCLLAVSPVIRGAAYETFYLSHVTAAVLLTACLWLHIASDSLSRWVVVGGAGLLALSSLLRLCVGLWLNVNIRAGTYILPRVQFKTSEGLLLVTVNLTNPIRIRPGQHVYLRVPFLTLDSWLQSHPFTIVSWEMTDETDTSAGPIRASRLNLVVDPMRGLTWSMAAEANAGAAGKLPGHRAILDGPYGPRKEMADYGTVLMVATGMGIFALVPHIKGLLRACKNATAKTRKIYVVWEVADRRRPEFVIVKGWMDEFLRADDDMLALMFYLLHPGLQQPGLAAAAHELAQRRADESGPGPEDAGPPRRIREGDYGLPSDTLMEEIVRDSEIRKLQGRLLISVSARGSVRDSLGAFIRKSGDLEYLDLMELDYQPQ